MGTPPRITFSTASQLAWLVTLASLGVACGGSDSGAVAPADAGEDASSTDAAPPPDAGADGAPNDPARNDDPPDLDATSGDASLDIASSWVFFDAGQPWVRAEFYGAWPPAAALYDWSCSVLLGTANAPLVTYTVTSLNGTQTSHAEGIDQAKVTFAVEPKGFRVLFGDATLTFDAYALECAVKKTNTAPLAQDDSGPFDAQARQARPFGP